MTPRWKRDARNHGRHKAPPLELNLIKVLISINFIKVSICHVSFSLCRLIAGSAVFMHTTIGHESKNFGEPRAQPVEFHVNGLTGSNNGTLLCPLDTVHYKNKHSAMQKPLTNLFACFHLSRNARSSIRNQLWDRLVQCMLYEHIRSHELKRKWNVNSFIRWWFIVENLNILFLLFFFHSVFLCTLHCHSRILYKRFDMFLMTFQHICILNWFFHSDFLRIPHIVDSDNIRVDSFTFGSL